MQSKQVRFCGSQQTFGLGVLDRGRAPPELVSFLLVPEREYPVGPLLLVVGAWVLLGMAHFSVKERAISHNHAPICLRSGMFMGSATGQL